MGPPADPDEAVRVLRRAAELGVTLFDTADSYGPWVAEPLLRRALAPYGDDIVIATKAGLTRQGPDRWTPVGRPAYLRQQCEMSLRILPWFPLATGGLAKPGGPLEAIASRLSATPSQLALAWLLHRSPVMLPIPGTSSVEHLEQNVAAAELELANTDLDFQLKQHGVSHVVLIGLLANTRVESTGRFAMELGYHVTLVRDATAAFEQGSA